MVERLRVAKTPQYRVALMATLFKAVVYNPTLTLGMLESIGATGA